MKLPTDPPLVIPVDCAPEQAPCPHCGRLARRKRRPLRRRVRTIAYKRVAYLDITYSEYKARCGCCQTFRTGPEGVLPKHTYDNKVRQAVLEHILDDRMNVEATRACLRRDFLLDLSQGFVYDCLHEAVRQTDCAAYRRQVLEHFRGTLCLDELHLGDYTLLLATDPLGDFPVAFALVSSNDQDHMRRFLRNLKDGGLCPRVVVTDGSGLYPALLAELWPEAEHQLCVFHVQKDLNDKVLDAVKRLRRQKSRRGNAGRKRQPGRPRKGAPRKRRGPTAKQQAHFVFKKRHLIVKRREKMTAGEEQDLTTMLGYIPALWVLRRFADAVYEALAAEQTEGQAWQRWQALQRSRAFRAVPELAAALGLLDEGKFRKVIAYLRSPAGQRVRTNNHVERCNRQLRWLEKVRYKWRQPRGVVRFVLLWMARAWDERLGRPAEARQQQASPAGAPPPGQAEGAAAPRQRRAG
jgi:hypothetical protein